jgi:hypothetical protein
MSKNKYHILFVYRIGNLLASCFFFILFILVHFNGKVCIFHFFCLSKKIHTHTFIQNAKCTQQCWLGLAALSWLRLLSKEKARDVGSHANHLQPRTCRNIIFLSNSYQIKWFSYRLAKFIGSKCFTDVFFFHFSLFHRIASQPTEWTLLNTSFEKKNWQINVKVCFAEIYVFLRLRFAFTNVALETGRRMLLRKSFALKAEHQAPARWYDNLTWQAVKVSWMGILFSTLHTQARNCHSWFQSM